MSERKVIVCLANSHKPGGRCVAGIEVIDRQLGGWIRPVSSHGQGELFPTEIAYADGVAPRPLDIMSVPVLGAQAHFHQPENWFVDTARKRRYHGRIEWEQLDQLISHDEHLWLENDSSSSNGLHDRIDADFADQVGDSLRFLWVANLRLKVFTGWWDGRRKSYGQFSYLAQTYELSVTDPLIRDAYLEVGTSDLGPCYLTISLAEEFHGYCYKVIAAVLTEERVLRGD